MSMSSSATASAGYNTPKAVALFLVKFDRRQGYELAWSKSTNDISFEGLEYKAFPSGIHLYEENTIYISQQHESTTYYGLSRFKQLNLNHGSDNDRSKLKMYSLGVLMEPLKNQWQPNNAGNIGWEHLDAIDDTLVAFLKDEKIDLLEELFSKLTGSGHLDVRKTPANPIAHHPLFKLPTILSAVGPLIFPIFKAALLRKRILVINHSSQSGDLLHEGNNRDYGTVGALVYLITVISAVPQDVVGNFVDKLFSKPLYTLGLHDTDSPALKEPGYIGSTSDEILKLQKNLYDIAILMPTSDFDLCELASGEDAGKAEKATFNDYTKFLKLYKKLPLVNGGSNNDDLSSIRTSTSFLSALRFGASEDTLAPFEPQWWRRSATTPMSWREYLWLAFAWFASAGTTNRSATEQYLETLEEDQQAKSINQQFTDLTQIVSQFHSLAKKWFVLIDEIVTETLEDNGYNERRSSLLMEAPLQRKITLELAIQDIVDMELDPYSEQDIEFVKDFVLFYWANVIDDVEIGIGLHGFCC